jgi:hypothetical protein
MAQSMPHAQAATIKVDAVASSTLKGPSELSMLEPISFAPCRRHAVQSVKV